MTRSREGWGLQAALAALLALLLLAWSNPAAAAGRRVALVIGNSAYAAGGVLPNPPKDAALVGGALRRAGFETIDLRTDLGVGPFRDALRQFQQKSDGAEVALVYYAGHGIEAKGVNWLIPVDAALKDERALPYEALSLDLVLEAVAGARVRVVMLDACRDNPYGRTWTAGTRSVSRGLVRTEADDVLVVFAAAPGQQANDGDGGNSPFAMAVAQRLPQGGMPIQLLGGLIRDDVMAATGNQQRPFVSASVSGTPFYLVPGTEAAAAPAPAPASLSAEAAMWQSAERIDSPAAYQAYLAQHPSGAHAGLAQAAMAKLQTPAAQVASILPPPAATPAAASPAPVAVPAADPMSQGRALVLKGEYAAAEQAFQLALAASPNGPDASEARFWLGRAHGQRLEHAKAVDAFTAALAGWPQTVWAPEAVVELGRSLMALERRPDACMALRQLALHYPNAPKPLVTRANLVRRGAGCPMEPMMAAGGAGPPTGAAPTGGGMPRTQAPARRPGGGPVPPRRARSF